MHRGERLPVFSASGRAKRVSQLLALCAPGRDIHELRVLRVQRNVVQNILVACAEMGEARPILPTITRDKNDSRARSQKDAIGIVGIVGKTAYVASIRPQNSPLARPERRATGQGDRQYNQQLTLDGS